MELIPASLRALQEMAATTADVDAVMIAVRAAADAVVQAVPHCVGMSVTLVEAGRSVTLMSTTTSVASLDAVQYLDGGPCEESVALGDEVGVVDLLSEERWALFSRAAAAQGVRSSLSLPLRADGEVIGGVNLYAATSDAFVGRYRAVAIIFGAAVEEAISNADLSMSTRARAESAQDDLRDRAHVDQAVGVLVAQRGISVAAAQAQIADAASRAGISDAQAATVIVEMRTSHQD